MNHSDGIEELRTRFVEVSADSVSPADFEALRVECGAHPDLRRLRRLLRRCQLGEPVEYVLGFQEFRGRRFAVDKRVYITDPELTHLVDAVIEYGRKLKSENGASPLLVEFGVGCGSLSISVKKEFPEARIIGIDLDSDAIEVALKNASTHQTDLMLMESDLFSDLPEDIVPDLIFGDPPWGDDSSLYDDDRPASHYHAMPVLSAFPSGGITGIHEAILEDVRNRGWNSSIILNLGTLGREHADRLAAMTEWHESLNFNGITLLHCKMKA